MVGSIGAQVRIQVTWASGTAWCGTFDGGRDYRKARNNLELLSRGCVIVAAVVWPIGVAGNGSSLRSYA